MPKCIAVRPFVFGVTATLMTTVVLSLCLGALALQPKHVLLALFSLSDDAQAHAVVHQIRLPRILLACLLGALLGASGAAMQGLFRNPLADPALIGVSAGASVGASIAIVFGAGLATSMGLPLISVGAFIGGLVAVSLVYKLSNKHGVRAVSTMLLIGIAIAAIAAAIVQLLLLTANNDMLRQMSLWQMGGVDNANYLHVGLAAVVAILIAVPLFKACRPLDALLLGESEARYLGVNVQRLQRHVILIVAAAVSCSVTLAGTIAFVGLMVPHIVRLCIGPNHTRLIPCSALVGALLLLVADTVARTILSPIEIPVGLVTALLGGPFFILLLVQRQNKGQSDA